MTILVGLSLADVVDVGYCFPRTIGLLLPDDHVLTFFVGYLSLLGFGFHVVGAVFVGEIAGARDLDVGGLEGEAGTRHVEHRLPGHFDGIFALHAGAVIGEIDGVIGVVRRGFVEIF